MRTLFTMVAGTVTMAVLVSCQTGSSLVDARQMAIKLNEQIYVPPPRSSADILESLSRSNNNNNRIKGDCNPSLNHIFTRQELENYISLLGRDGEYVAYSQAEQHIRKGNVRRAIELMEISLRLTKENDERTKRFARLAMYNILVLDLEAAKFALDQAKIELNSLFWPDYTPRSRARFWVLLAQGFFDEAHGKFDSAEFYFREAVDTAGKSFIFGTNSNGTSTYDYNSRGRYASSYLRLANNLLKQGRLLEAEIKIRDLLALSSQNVPEARARALDVLGRIFLEQGRYADAEKIMSLAIGEFRDACVEQDNIGLILTRETYGKILVLVGKSAEANAYFKGIQAAVDSEESTFSLLFDDNIFRAMALLREQRWGEARAVLRRSLGNLDARFKGDSYEIAERKGLLAISLVEIGENEQAWKLFSDSIPVLYAGAGSAEISNTTRFTSDYVRKYIFESYLRHTIGHDSKQINSSARNLAIVEGFKLASVLRENSVAQEWALSSARITIDNPELSAIIRDSQDIRKQISALEENLLRIRTFSQDQIDVGVVAEIKDSIAQLHDARLVLTQEISRRFPRYAELTQPNPLTPLEIQNVLQPGDSLVAIYLAEDTAYLWAIPKHGDVSYAFVKLEPGEIVKVVDDLRLALNPTNVSSLGDIPDFDLALAYGLYQKLLEPVRDGWKDATNLIVVAHGPLGQLPFSLLPIRPAQLAPHQGLLFANYREVPWLARTHAVTVLPSVASLRLLRSTSATSAERLPFVGFGDPYFNTQQALMADLEAPIQVAMVAVTNGAPLTLRNISNTRAVDSASLGLLPRLEDTRLEILAIASMLGADATQDVYLGRNASERNVKSNDLSRYKVISFATHGLLPGDLDGLTQPALALSSPQVTGDMDDDGLLTTGEILSLKLNADWVVLSACNTAAGNGEGAAAISGLGQAFFYAGSRALLVSNWPVHSKATAELTKTLFSLQARDESLDRSRALQQTRLHMIDEAVETGSDAKPIFAYAHPIFWAPFTLMGDGGS